MKKFGLVLVSLLSLVGCGGQEDVAGSADPALVESQKALAPAGKTHLIMLSGQSNMSRMIWADEGTGAYLLKQVFEPTLQQAFPNDDFIIVPVAEGGREISRWVPNGPLYNQMVNTAKQRIAGKKIDSITFIWRQGEADHDNNVLAKAYEGNLRKLYTQLKGDFPGQQINWVIGRLNDAKVRMTPTWEYHNNWMLIRQNEVDVANSTPHAVWQDCDAFNDAAGDDIHGLPSDYLKQQKAFAERTIELIKGG